MKILLAAINAKYIHSNPALLSLRAYAGKYLDQIEIRTYTINQHEEEILAEATRWELRHGGLSGRTAQQFIDHLQTRD